MADGVQVKAARLAALQSPLIRLLVGPDAHEIQVHRDLLCATSTYFRGALLGNFVEAKLRKIELDEEKGEVIEAYVYWLYYGKVAEPRKLDPEAPDVLDRTTVALTQGQLIDIWLFGDRRGIPALQNHALIMFAQHMNETTKVDRNLIPIVYDNTTKTAPRRRLFVTKAAVFWDWGAVPKSDTVIPPAFMMDACVRLGQIRGDLAMGFRPLPLTDSTPIENYLLGEKL